MALESCLCGHSPEEHSPECEIEECGCIHYEADFDLDDEDE